MPKMIENEFVKKDAIIRYLNWRSEIEKNHFLPEEIRQARQTIANDIKEFVEHMNVYSLAVPTCKECASFRPGYENGYCREHDRFVEFTDFCSRGTPSSTIPAPGKPLTLDELRAMVNNPVYDCLGQVWYIVESYYDHDLIMTDGTHFNDENKYARVSKRFYCRPTIPAPQWISVEERLPEEQKEVLIYLPEYDSVEMASLFTIPSMNLREWVQNEDAYMLDEVSYWMPLPEPPDKRYKCRYADDNGVCSKLSGNGEIMYCVEGPCPYDMLEGA